MPWPIPEFSSPSSPARIRLLVWLPILAAVAVTSVGAILLLWPREAFTTGQGFWLLLGGVPVCLCSLLFGFRRARWEREQLIAEEGEREIERLTDLWENWARRHIEVSRVITVLPVAVTPKQLVEKDTTVGLNIERALGLPWALNESAERKREMLLEFVTDRFSTDLQTLQTLQTLDVVLILDDVSRDQIVLWEADVNRILKAVHSRLKVQVTVAESANCKEWLVQQLDDDVESVRLVIAAQIWPQEGSRVFSEAAAGFLLRPRITERRVGSKAGMNAVDISVGQLNRPMPSSRGEIVGDIQQLLSMQLAPRSLTRVITTRLDNDIKSAMSALSVDDESRTPVVDIDDVMGLSGPVNGWISLAVALEAASQDQGSTLVAWQEPDDNTVAMCLVGVNTISGSRN